jgi:hypothetical protein
MRSGIGVEIKSDCFFYARVYNRFFVASSEDQVERMISSFEEDEWKDKRLQSWTIWEIS